MVVEVKKTGWWLVLGSWVVLGSSCATGIAPSGGSAGWDRGTSDREWLLQFAAFVTVSPPADVTNCRVEQSLARSYYTG